MNTGAKRYLIFYKRVSLAVLLGQNVKHESGNYDLSDSFTAVDSIGHGDKEQHH